LPFNDSCSEIFKFQAAAPQASAKLTSGKSGTSGSREHRQCGDNMKIAAGNLWAAVCIIKI